MEHSLLLTSLLCLPSNKLSRSSIIEATKLILNLFIFFFLRKDSARIKTLTNKKPTNKTKGSKQKNNKGNNFLRAQTSKGVKVACFAFGAFFMFKIFSQKENKQV